MHAVTLFLHVHTARPCAPQCVESAHPLPLSHVHHHIYHSLPGVPVYHCTTCCTAFMFAASVLEFMSQSSPGRSSRKAPVWRKECSHPAYAGSTAVGLSLTPHTPAAPGRPGVCATRRSVAPGVLLHGMLNSFLVYFYTPAALGRPGACATRRSGAPDVQHYDTLHSCLVDI